MYLHSIPLLLEGYAFQKSKQEITEAVSLCKKDRKHGGVPILLTDRTSLLGSECGVDGGKWGWFPEIAYVTYTGKGVKI